MSEELDFSSILVYNINIEKKKEGTYMADIKKDYYPFPAQVKFAQRLDDGEWSEDNWGIAFHEYIVCLGCGQPIDLDDEVIVIEYFANEDWVPCDEGLWSL